MEFMVGGELEKRIRKHKYTEDEAKQLYFVLAKTIKYLHDLHIVHRDIKPANILMVSKDDHTNIKLVDFGFATRTEQKMNQLCGTIPYMAPEILKHEMYGSEVDMWSMGILLYFLLTRKHPFTGSSTKDLKKNIMNGFFPDISSPISLDAQDVVYKLLNINPNRRMNISQLLDHPWLNQC